MTQEQCIQHFNETLEFIAAEVTDTTLLWCVVAFLVGLCIGNSVAHLANRCQG